eukprot:355053-Chlamydomonas_euryale.AAC.7
MHGKQLLRATRPGPVHILCYLVMAEGKIPFFGTACWSACPTCRIDVECRSFVTVLLSQCQGNVVVMVAAGSLMMKVYRNTTRIGKTLAHVTSGATFEIDLSTASR